MSSQASFIRELTDTLASIFYDMTLSRESPWMDKACRYNIKLNDKDLNNYILFTVSFEKKAICVDVLSTYNCESENMCQFYQNRKLKVSQHSGDVQKVEIELTPTMSLAFEMSDLSTRLVQFHTSQIAKT